MKTKLISLLLLIVLPIVVTSCRHEEVRKGIGIPYAVSEFKHDSCYYLACGDSFIIHKANCPNPIHKTQ